MGLQRLSHRGCRNGSARASRHSKGDAVSTEYVRAVIDRTGNRQTLDGLLGCGLWVLAFLGLAGRWYDGGCLKTLCTPLPKNRFLSKNWKGWLSSDHPRLAFFLGRGRRRRAGLLWAGVLGFHMPTKWTSLAPVIGQFHREPDCAKPRSRLRSLPPL